MATTPPMYELTPEFLPLYIIVLFDLLSVFIDQLLRLKSASGAATLR